MPPRRRRSLREHFAARLAEARLRAGISQRELARRAGWDQVAGGVRINRYELAKSEPDLAALEKLAKQLHVPPAYLLATSPEQAEAFLAVSQEPVMAQAIKALQKMSADKRAEWVESLLAVADEDEQG